MNFLLIPLPLLSPRNSMDPSALTPRIGTRTTVSWISIPLITTPSIMFTRVPASSTWRQNHQRKAPTIAARVSMTPPTTGCCLPRDRQPGSTLKNSVLSPHPTQPLGSLILAVTRQTVLGLSLSVEGGPLRRVRPPWPGVDMLPGT